MNIRKLHHIHHEVAWLKPWYFLVPTLVFAGVAVDGLRDNYSKMVDLREAVYKADQENGDVEKALYELRAHVHGHMNTNLASGSNAIKPPIQLKARYERLMATEQDRIKQQNAQVTAEGEQTCALQFPNAGYNAPRIECVQSYVAAHALTQPNSIPDQLYKFDFVSPRWSPDRAGLAIVASVVFFVLFVARWLIERWMRHRLE